LALSPEGCQCPQKTRIVGVPCERRVADALDGKGHGPRIRSAGFPAHCPPHGRGTPWLVCLRPAMGLLFFGI
jgi:hypothetical protein